MAFEEAFNPGMSRAREQAERERLLPAPPPVIGPPQRELPGLDVEVDVRWSPSDIHAVGQLDTALRRREDGTGESANAHSPEAQD